MRINYAKIEEFLEIELAQDRIESWRQLTKGQYRINEQLDIYPKSKRYFVVETEERGDYDSLEGLIDLLL